MQQGNAKKSEKSIKTVNIEGESLHIFWTTWGILILRKDVAYEKIKSLQKAGFDPLSRKHILIKTTAFLGFNSRISF